MILFGDPAQWLPFIFASLLGLSILIYVCLDGFDLGVGLLFPFAGQIEKDRMVASIGPFWDANETWLVLAVGLLLVAFPFAHGEILGALYLPVAIMLIGLILRGVAFEFRVKAPAQYKRFWDNAFLGGSLAVSLCQGFMLGMYIMGLEFTPMKLTFSLLTAGCLTVAYSFIGACWIIMKTDGDLQKKAVGWARGGIYGLVLGLGSISLATPLVSQRIFERWFTFPDTLFLAPLPIMSAVLIFALWYTLRHLPASDDRLAWFPFVAAMALFALGFCGMAYSFYPYVVPERKTIYEAASSPDALFIMLIGVLIVLPIICAYTALSYFIFRGKATELRYY
ncbi:MAG: cytochrome d ubiquinol oxidase subunit II [Rhodobacteraceae bacterium]|nr:cytochrome d ubiquinol oxidase subunit II [Paracoccaceae bacterium]